MQIRKVIKRKNKRSSEIYYLKSAYKLYKTVIYKE